MGSLTAPHSSHRSLTRVPTQPLTQFLSSFITILHNIQIQFFTSSTHTSLTFLTPSHTLRLTFPQLPRVHTIPHNFAHSSHTPLTPSYTAPLPGLCAAPGTAPHCCQQSNGLTVPRGSLSVSHDDSHLLTQRVPTYFLSRALRDPQRPSPRFPLSRSFTRFLTQLHTHRQTSSSAHNSRTFHTQFLGLLTAPYNSQRPSVSSQGHVLTSPDTVHTHAHSCACLSSHFSTGPDTCPRASHGSSRLYSVPFPARSHLLTELLTAHSGSPAMAHASSQLLTHPHGTFTAGLAALRCTCGPSPASHESQCPCPPTAPHTDQALPTSRLRTQGCTAARGHCLPTRLLHAPQAPWGRLSRDAPQAMPTRGAHSSRPHSPALSFTRLMPVLVPVSSRLSPSLLPSLTHPAACSPLTGPAQLQAGLLCPRLPPPPPSPPRAETFPQKRGSTAYLVGPRILQKQTQSLRT